MVKGYCRLKKRSDFLKTAKGRRWNTPFFNLQSKNRFDEACIQNLQPELPRIGFTVTKKTGNSVKRNRIKRRLRSAVQNIQTILVERAIQKINHDYVLVAKETMLTVDFIHLKNELISAFEGVHRMRSSAKAEACRPQNK